MYLVGLARVAVARNHPWRATRLLGAAETQIDVTQSMVPADRTIYERTVESLRATLGKEGFAFAWAEGGTMTPQAILEAEESAWTQQKSAQPSTPAFPAGLTAREVEVLRLIALGWTDAQIAEDLVISPRTVNTHTTTIYSKIGVTSRAAATRYALEHQLV